MGCRRLRRLRAGRHRRHRRLGPRALTDSAAADPSHRGARARRDHHHTDRGDDRGLRAGPLRLGAAHGDGRRRHRRSPCATPKCSTRRRAGTARRSAPASSHRPVHRSPVRAPETWEPRVHVPRLPVRRDRRVAGRTRPADADPRGRRAHRHGRTGLVRDIRPAAVNQLHANAVWSMRGNFVGVPTDCPQRDERLGWTGDINAFAPTAAFLYDVRGVLGSWLQDLAAEQKATGYVPVGRPRRAVHPVVADRAVERRRGQPARGRCTRNTATSRSSRDAYESMTAFIRQVDGLLDSDGLWSTRLPVRRLARPGRAGRQPRRREDRPPPGRLRLPVQDHPGDGGDRASCSGTTDDAAQFAALHQRVRAAFRREFVTETGRVVDESATALRPGDHVRHPRRRAEPAGRRPAGRARREPPDTGSPPGSPEPRWSRTRCQQHRPPRRGVQAAPARTGCPSFLYPVTMGATTIWERWDSVRPDGTINSTGMTSLNHYALGAVVGLDAPHHRRAHRARAGLASGSGSPRSPGGRLMFARTAHVRPRLGLAPRWTGASTTATSSSTSPFPTAPPPPSSSRCTPKVRRQEVGSRHPLLAVSRARWLWPRDRVHDGHPDQGDLDRPRGVGRGRGGVQGLLPRRADRRRRRPHGRDAAQRRSRTVPRRRRRRMARDLEAAIAPREAAHV